jgi:hypothetical protein
VAKRRISLPRTGPAAEAGPAAGREAFAQVVVGSAVFEYPAPEVRGRVCGGSGADLVNRRQRISPWAAGRRRATEEGPSRTLASREPPGPAIVMPDYVAVRTLIKGGFPNRGAD